VECCQEAQSACFDVFTDTILDGQGHYCKISINKATLKVESVVYLGSDPLEVTSLWALVGRGDGTSEDECSRGLVDNSQRPSGEVEGRGGH
jgi:hypothetical protein